MPLSKNTTITIAAAIVVAGAAAYFLWMRPAADDTVTVADYGPASTAQATFLTLAGQLDPISFDTAVLSDVRFLSLVDITTAIIPEDSGRTDPFAPLPGVARE